MLLTYSCRLRGRHGHFDQYHTNDRQIDNPTADWVVTAALNAFIAFEAAQYSEVRKFATVGTGSGTDAIAALEIFPRLSKIAMTDLHDEVVKIARLNLLSAVEKADDKIRDVALGAVARSGDILAPLRDQGSFDLIYELVSSLSLQRMTCLMSFSSNIPSTDQGTIIS